MSLQPSVTEQIASPTSVIAFRDYLQRHHLTPLDVASASGVRYLLVWRLWTGTPISRQYEQPIRQALFQLTGEPYAAPILVQQHTQGQAPGSFKTAHLRKPE